MRRNKGKEKEQQPFKEAAEPDRLSEEAYKICIKIDSSKEIIYPFIPINLKVDIPIEEKYKGLKPYEISEFYCRNFALSNTGIKNFAYYQQILIETNSVLIEPSKRGQDVAYSKFIIKRILTPDQWPSADLYVTREFKAHVFPKQYNYLDYIQAWESALYYENRQLKFSWWIQFRTEEEKPKFPNWFTRWFYTFGLYPIIMPLKVKALYKEFKSVNPSMFLHGLKFACFYQVTWIIKWEYALLKQGVGEKFGENLIDYPCLGRRILSKWWDKYNFFENNIYLTQKIKSFEPLKMVEEPVEKPADLESQLKTLISNFSADDLINQLLKLAGKQNEAGTSSPHKKKRIELEDELTASNSESKQDMEEDSQDSNEL